MHSIYEELVRLRHCELLSEARRQRRVAQAGRASLERANDGRSSGFRPVRALRSAFGRS